MTSLSLLLALLLVAYLARGYLRGVSRQRLAELGKRAAGVAGLLVGGFLTVTGRGAIGVPIAAAAAALLGLTAVPSLGGGGQRRTGQRSRVRSRAIEMELDLDTGQMSGRVLAGSFAGRELDALSPSELARLAAELAGDQESLRLLEAYLDRRAPGWREHAERDADGRGGGDARPARPGPMTEQEAYDVLGLQPGAGLEEIRGAYRSLMKKIHPDQGGSAYLAARVNEAKDVLTRRHR